jgi:hypothetical protein
MRDVIVSVWKENICCSLGFDQNALRQFLIPNFLSSEMGPTFGVDAPNRPENGALMRFGGLDQSLMYQ